MQIHRKPVSALAGSCANQRKRPRSSFPATLQRVSLHPAESWPPPPEPQAFPSFSPDKDHRSSMAHLQFLHPKARTKRDFAAFLELGAYCLITRCPSNRFAMSTNQPPRLPWQPHPEGGLADHLRARKGWLYADIWSDGSSGNKVWKWSVYANLRHLGRCGRSGSVVSRQWASDAANAAVPKVEAELADRFPDWDGWD